MRIPASLEHLAALTDDVGIIQHAIEDIPNRSTGYCVDDVGRALIVATQAAEYPQLQVEAMRLGRIYLAYLLDAQRPDGRLRNFMGYDRRWLDDIGSEDSFGRGIWGLGFAAAHTQKASWRHACMRIILKALPHMHDLTHLRAKAYAAIGLTQAYALLLEAGSGVDVQVLAIGEELQAQYQAAKSPGWAWFNPFMTYDNARLSEAMIRIGGVLGRNDFVRTGLESLDFYAEQVIEGGIFVPIGNNGWWQRDGGERSRFDQQPIEAAGLIDAALCAYEQTGRDNYRRLAEIGYDWFFGRNSVNAPLVLDGGCRDGFSPVSVNRNMGAESTLAYLASAFALGPKRYGRVGVTKSGQSTL